jgi:hypothetical protein
MWDLVLGLDLPRSSELRWNLKFLWPNGACPSALLCILLLPWCWP